MNDKYCKLQELSFDSYLIDSPVEIENGVLLLNKTTREVLLKLKINILSPNPQEISSVTIKIEYLDDEGKEIPSINNPTSFTYRDVFLLKNKSFGIGNQIKLDARVRKANVWISKVVYLDSHVWIPANNEIKPIDQRPIDSLKPELSDQLWRDLKSLPSKTRERLTFFPVQLDNYWLCKCGRPNHNDANKCCRCDASRKEVFELINEKNLQKNLEEYKENIRVEEERVRLEEEQAKLLEEEKARRQEEENYIRSKRNKRTAVFIGLFLILLITFLNVVVPAINYSLASNYLAKSEYDYAIYMFYALGDYRDSTDMVNEANYQKANNFLVEKHFDEAIKVFTYIKNYDDSTEMITETKYLIGLQLMDSDETLSEALEIFYDLGIYKNSIDNISEIKYLLAKNRIENKQFTSALNYLEEIIDYKDASGLYNEIIENQKSEIYLTAIEKASNREYREAYSLLVDLDYQDSSSLAKKYESLILRFSGKLLGNKSWFDFGEPIELIGTLTGVKPNESENLIIRWFMNEILIFEDTHRNISDSMEVQSKAVFVGSGIAIGRAVVYSESNNKIITQFKFNLSGY